MSKAKIKRLQQELVKSEQDQKTAKEDLVDTKGLSDSKKRSLKKKYKSLIKNTESLQKQIKGLKRTLNRKPLHPTVRQADKGSREYTKLTGVSTAGELGYGSPVISIGHFNER